MPQNPYTSIDAETEDRHYTVPEFHIYDRVAEEGTAMQPDSGVHYSVISHMRYHALYSNCMHRVRLHVFQVLSCEKARIRTVVCVFTTASND